MDMYVFLPQDAILEKLVIPHGKSVFFRLAVGGSDFCPNGERGVVFYQRPEGPSQWRPLLGIASRVSPTSVDVYRHTMSNIHCRNLQQMTLSFWTLSCCSLQRCVRYMVCADQLF